AAGARILGREGVPAGLAFQVGHQDGSGSPSPSAQPLRDLPPCHPAIVTRWTGWPRRASSAPAAAIPRSSTVGQQAMRPGLSGWLTARARSAPRRSASVWSLNRRLAVAEELTWSPLPPPLGEIRHAKEEEVGPERS